MSTLAVEAPVAEPLGTDRIRRISSHVVLVAQLALATLLVQRFRLESRTFFEVVALASAGFLPHALLPRAWRLPAFGALSAAAVLLALGVTNTLWLALVGTALVSLCHLPTSARVRTVLLLAAAALLAAMRSDRIDAPWSSAVWAVLGSMFMFRLALYFHAVRNEPVKPTPMEALAYFLMLPNPVFPLFPVVDFTGFRNAHYPEGKDAVAIYQTGMLWIARGLVHLLLYRIVYHNLPAQPMRLTALSDLLWYVVGTFALYLRVSGQFHFIVGFLRLYGFALPETHRLFYLTSSFTDFWRRINIYWKDFMMKLVYYPSFFMLRRWGNTLALIVATAIVFAATWFLHGYQWFWLLGTFPKSLPDLLFWTILGLCVIVGSLRELKRGRVRSLSARAFDPKLGRKTIVMFCTLTVLWSLWSAESIVEWAWMWRAAAHVDVLGIVLLVALLGTLFALGGRTWTTPAGPRAWWRRDDARAAGMLAALLFTSLPAVTARTGVAAPYLADMRATTLSARDAAVQRRGYYERLDRGPRLGAQGWETSIGRPASWKTIPQTAIYHPRRDFRIYDLKPNMTVTYALKPLTTNQWGVRDLPRTLAKPAGTYRIALLGPSVVLGTGVRNEEIFSRLVEQRLNAELSPKTGLHYEVLNFGMPGYSMLQQLVSFEEDAARFSPDVVMFTGYTSLYEHTTRHLAQVLGEGRRIPYPALDSLLASWHVSLRLPWHELEGLLHIASDDIHAWTTHRLAADARARGITPMLLLLDNVGSPKDYDPGLMQAARDEHFPIFDLFDVYGPAEGHSALWVAEWDKHPNATGHRMIADALYARLVPALTAAASAPAAPK